MARKLVVLAALVLALRPQGVPAQPTPPPASLGLAELQALVVPDALLVAVLDLRAMRGSSRLRELWAAMLLAEPDLPKQLGALETGLGVRLDEDLDALVLSSSAKGSVLALAGRLPEAKIVEAARGEKLTVTRDSTSVPPLYLARGEKGAPVALGFAAQGLVIGAEADVRATLGSTGGREPAALVARAGGHLICIALSGVDRLLAEQAKVQATPPPDAANPAAQAVQKLASLTFALDLDRKLDLSLQAGFSAQDAASTVQALLNQALQQAGAAQDVEARKAVQAMKVERDGSTVNLSLVLSAAQLGPIVRNAQREITAVESTHVETGLKLKLPRLPHAWALQASRDQWGSFWKATLPKGDGFLRLQAYDVSKETSWSIEKEAQDLEKRVNAQQVLSNRFDEVGGVKVNCLEVLQGGAQHRYEQFPKDGKLYLLIGSTTPAAFKRLGEEMDFIVAQILPPPAAAGSPAADSPASYLETMAALQRQQMSYQVMSNILQMQHETSMAIIYNMGGGYHYEYR